MLLSEVQGSLSLFAEAVAGTPVAFSTAEAEECWPLREATDAALVLPLELDDRAAFRAVLLHRVRCAAWAETGDDLFDRLLRIVEDHRIFCATPRDYPGARAAQLTLMARAQDTALASVSVSESPLEHCIRVLRLRSFGAGIDQLYDAAPHVSAREIEGLVGRIDRVRAAGCRPGESEVVAADLFEFLTGSTPRIAGLEIVADSLDDGGADLDGESAGVSLEGGTPTEVVEGDAAGSGQFADDFGDADMAASDAGEAEDSPTVSFELPAQHPLGAGEVRTFVYDEWDYHEQRHRPAWCRVREERVVGDDLDFLEDVRARHRDLRARLRHSLFSLPRQELVRIRRSLDGDEIDVDAAIEAVTDRRSGAPVDDRVLERRDRAARDVATAFLVDLSASTSSPAVPPEPTPISEIDPMDDPMSYEPLWGKPPDFEPVRRVIDVAVDAVTLMGDALDELGDRFAVYGFSGTGRDDVEFKVGKDFADKATPMLWAGVGAMKPLRYTRMGPAVRHATTKLAAEGARTKLLIVVSDGYPQDTDYGRDRTDRDYGIHDTARALADAEQRGVETFCVTIDPAGHDYLRRMCREDRYLVIDDVESLPARLAEAVVELRR